MSGPRIFEPEYYERMRRLEADGWWNAGMRDVAARLLELAVLPDTGRILDVGCGSGQTLSWFLEHRPGWSGAGVDVSIHGLAAGRAAGVPGLVAGSGLALPFPNAWADVIVCLDVLQHLPLEGGDRKALSEMRRVLRPGGVLLVRTNAQAIPYTPPDPEHDFRKYRPWELRRRLQEMGFEIVRLSRANALLGLAEIPRELAAERSEGKTYHGILARPNGRLSRLDAWKRRWLALEGSAVAAGWRLPAGRTLVALCRARPTRGGTSER